jgi:hypothetical protein
VGFEDTFLRDFIILSCDHWQRPVPATASRIGGYRVMRKLRPRLPDEDNNRSGNFFGFIAAVLLVAFSLFVLLRLQHFIDRRDCYEQHMHACAGIGSGRYTHF